MSEMGQGSSSPEEIDKMKNWMETKMKEKEKEMEEREEKLQDKTKELEETLSELKEKATCTDERDGSGKG